jgi:hypothetical protein
VLASGRNKALVGGAAVLSVVAIVGVILTPRLFGGTTDPGCKAYAGTALTAYNKTITDLNAQASTQQLDADMATAITDLTAAAAKTRSPSTASALNGLLTEIKTVRTDVARGSVPAATVGALNAASTTADHACS